MQIRGQWYAIDIRLMEQTNVNTKFVRRIRRSEEVKSVQDRTMFPRNWEPQSDDDAARDYAWWRKFVLVDVPKSHTEWQQVSANLTATLHGAQLVKLQRCQIRHLWYSYSNRHRMIQLKTNNTANVKQLWHGTSHTEPTAILRSEDGLDHRFSAAGFYGTGIYGAENASYSNSSYAFKVGTPISGCRDCRQLLLCKFALGEWKDYRMHTDSSLRLPPLKPGPTQVQYDSVRGGPHSGSIMHIVYSNDRVYPE
jgi:hypothetical protein